MSGAARIYPDVAWCCKGRQRCLRLTQTRGKRILPVHRRLRVPIGRSPSTRATQRARSLQPPRHSTDVRMPNRRAGCCGHHVGGFRRVGGNFARSRDRAAPRTQPPGRNESDLDALVSEHSDPDVTPCPGMPQRDAPAGAHAGGTRRCRVAPGARDRDRDAEPCSGFASSAIRRRRHCHTAPVPQAWFQPPDVAVAAPDAAAFGPRLRIIGATAHAWLSPPWSSERAGERRHR